MYKVKKCRLQSKLEGKDKESINQVPYLSQYTTWESDKIQENITYKTAKGLAHSQQVTTSRRKEQEALATFIKSEVEFKVTICFIFQPTISHF